MKNFLTENLNCYENSVKSAILFIQSTNQVSFFLVTARGPFHKFQGTSSESFK